MSFDSTRLHVAVTFEFLYIIVKPFPPSKVWLTSKTISNFTLLSDSSYLKLFISEYVTTCFSCN